MTLLLILVNIALSARLAVVLALASWAIVRSHHEGRPVTVASRRQWRRSTDLTQARHVAGAPRAGAALRAMR